jgi:hypothetical protein
VRHYERVRDQERVEQLLAGPRGRELCARLAGVPVCDVHDQDGSVVISHLLSREDDEDGPDLDSDDALAAVPVLAEVAEQVSYWGDYTAADPLEEPAVLATIRVHAEMAAGARGCQWWWSPLDRDAQGYVQWTGRSGEPAPVFESGHAAAMLRDLARDAAEIEQHMTQDRYKPAGSGVHGSWWSHPWPGAFSTTRHLGRLGSLLLAGREDGFGDKEAIVWPLAVADEARVWEINGPLAWQDLVSAYPRPATATYRHTWAWTDWDGGWLVPDWSAVASDWDGVYLSVAGYLATAGRALPVASARTMLAGWNPDETYWLADVITPSGEPQRWRTDDGDPLTWYRY